MSTLRTPVLVRPTRRPAEPQELCVVVGCHRLVCAVPARWIERLVLPDEVASIVAAPSPAAAGQPPLVLVGEKPYAAWNLGSLLGLAPLESAWVLLRVLHEGEVLPIALHTGPCLMVQPLAAGLALPAGVFRERPGAVASVLASLPGGGRVSGDVALWLDPARLWSAEELAAAATALRGAGRAMP